MRDTVASDFIPTCPSAHILGVKVSAVNMEDVIDFAEQAIAGRSPCYICVASVHGIMEAQKDPELRRIFNNAFLSVPDGMPLSWVGWLQGHLQMDRVFGPDLMARLCAASPPKGYRHFLYGGKPGVARQLLACLEQRFPGLQVVGTYTPPFRPLTGAEEEQLLAEVQAAQPDVLWVGISSPKQERFMAKYIGRLHVPLMVGVGAAFDFHTGRIRDCAPWIKRAGLQWMHRLLQDPRRLWRRYFYCVPAFLWRIGWQLAGLSRSSNRGCGTMNEPPHRAEVRS